MKTGIFAINQIARNTRLDKVHGMWTKTKSEIRLLVYNSWEEDHGNKFFYRVQETPIKISLIKYVIIRSCKKRVKKNQE